MKTPRKANPTGAVVEPKAPAPATDVGTRSRQHFGAELKNLIAVSAELPSVAEMEEQQARQLDAAINDNLQDLGRTVASAYLRIGAQLNAMRDGQGYIFLGFGTWGEYVASKATYGKTYVSCLLRLGQLDPRQLHAFIDEGISGSLLIEYAKATAKVEKIPELIEATWTEVKALPVRQAAQRLKTHVEEHRDEFKRKTSARMGRPAATVEQKVKKFLAALSEEERATAVKLVPRVAKDLGTTALRPRS